MTPAKKARGRPALPPDEAQTAMIRERVTPAQRAEYEARGGKVWLVKALARKLRKIETRPVTPAAEAARVKRLAKGK